MSVDRKDVEQMAYLARMEINDETINEVASSINDILGMVDQMQSVNTDNVEPLANALEATQRLRDDIVTATDQREQLQANAPACENGLFLVPKVID